MHKIRKKEEKRIVQAYPLGEHTPMEQQLIADGKIKKRVDGTYEVFSQEAAGTVGEIARPGDFIKIDSLGFPYPNEKLYFLKYHKRISENLYRQKEQELTCWFAEDMMCEEIEYLLAQQKLHIHPESEDAYFEAELWGTHLTAAKDAAVVIYQITKNDQGEITEVDFNFVERKEFMERYEMSKDMERIGRTRWMIENSNENSLDEL